MNKLKKLVDMPLSDRERMEVNRIRAKELRLQKKQREEGMKEQIIDLVLQNNRLRAQVNIQRDELRQLRLRVAVDPQQRLFSNQTSGIDHNDIRNETYNGTYNVQLNRFSSSLSPIMPLNQLVNAKANSSRKRKFAVSI